MGSVVPDPRLVGSVVLGHPAGSLDLSIYLGGRSGGMKVIGAGRIATVVFENDVGRILEFRERHRHGYRPNFILG